jgi:hypothetical protein
MRHERFRTTHIGVDDDERNRPRSTDLVFPEETIAVLPGRQSDGVSEIITV